MIRLQITLAPDEPESLLPVKAAAALGVELDGIAYIKKLRRSLDARRGRPPFFLWSIGVSLKDFANEKSVAEKAGFELISPEPEYSLPTPSRKAHCRPVVVGFGPAGIFASLLLASAGCMPIILERGSCIDERVAQTSAFFDKRTLLPESNIQFGEGGAGTFSDGKLGTLIGSADGRVAFVLKTFAEHTGCGELCYASKPHVGTDLLRIGIASLREKIISLGGEIFFNTRLTSLMKKDGAICGVEAIRRNGEKLTVNTDTVFLAVGHSARDTFEMLRDSGVTMEKKPFSVGLRIEHLQEDIDRAMYHGHISRFLPPADYKLSAGVSTGKTVYTFCMCPGGVIVPACSEPGGMVTNGMSFHARDGKNANSALLVGLLPSDTGDELFGGIELQRRLEQTAFALGGSDYTAPAQTVEDFMRGITTTSFGKITPSCLTGVKGADLRGLLPKCVSESIALALPEFDKKLRGFAFGDAVLTGVESRSTCPIRITRGENLQSALVGLYPVGEGAGYAGGITSAAVDGMKAAEKYLSAI